jgi:type III pantothenate kinase
VILLVDVGNTRIKWSTWFGGVIRQDGICSTLETAELAKVCQSGGISHAVVACVVGEAVRLSLARPMENAGIPIHWVQPQYSAHRLLNRYQPPASLGADRYAAMIAAGRHFQRDCVVASVGTAMTVDMLTGEGEFLGGCIVPGPDLMRASLRSGTAGIRPSSGKWQDYPRDTGAAVDSGIALALSGVVRGMRERLAGMGGTEQVTSGSDGPLPAVVLTGGARACIRPLLMGDVFEMDELVLEGLAWIARDLGFAG